MITTEMRFIEQKCTFEAKSLLHLCWKISTRHLKYLHILILYILNVMWFIAPITRKHYFPSIKTHTHMRFKR